ncbi:MAG: hypothetical protein IT303_14075 [Dehalococcoidia bacterium]|nr:hypothetical protein [Dehalococcoidia bacterium]
MRMHLHLPGPDESLRMRLVALTLIGVPAALLLLMGFGEMLGGDISGVQHIPEAALLLALMWAAWKFPWRAGEILVAGSVLLFAAWIVLVVTQGNANTPAWAWVATGIVVFAPPFAAGVLLLLGSRGAR